MSSRKPTQQPQRPRTERLDGFGVLRVDDTDRRGEVYRADRFVETAVRHREVLVSHRGASTRQTFTKVAEGGFRCARSLVAQLRVADRRFMHGAGEGSGGEVNLETLEGQPVVVHEGNIDTRWLKVACPVIRFVRSASP